LPTTTKQLERKHVEAKFLGVAASFLQINRDSQANLLSPLLTTNK